MIRRRLLTNPVLPCAVLITAEPARPVCLVKILLIPVGRFVSSTAVQQYRQNKTAIHNVTKPSWRRVGVLLATSASGCLGLERKNGTDYSTAALCQWLMA